MFRKIALFALMLLPLGVYAQETKIAYVNTEEIIMAMPETVAMRAEIEKQSKSLDSELKIMEDEFSKKYTAFMQQSDSLTESIKIRRMQEIQDLKDRAETFQRDAQQNLYKKQQELFAPIQQKVTDTIKAVGDEHGFTYMMEKGAFLYVSPHSVDATPLIKKKLGLQ